MRFVLRRLGFFVVTLWAAITLNFLIPRLMPGNAALSMMSRYKGHINPNAMHALEVAFGINTHESLVHAYFTYLGNIARLHFGISLLAIWLFSIKLGWAPESGGYDVTTTVAWSGAFVSDAFRHSVLPALTILVTSVGGWILTMRNNTITVLAEDYVRMARAKGLSPWRIMWTYAGRNAILPNLTGFAMSLGFVVGGAILVEFVFNYPGVGWMFLQSVENQDYALMQALFLMITVAVLVAILAADVATAVLDPRTRDRS